MKESFKTICAEVTGNICRVRIDRPEKNNAINTQLITELASIVALCKDEMREIPITILVLEGLPDIFCVGGDFDEMNDKIKQGGLESPDPNPLYNLWLDFMHSSFITISVVRGRVNAGGLGFVAASDIVLADNTASFSLSELLFGLFPACVLPFLSNRIGRQKSHYMTLMTRVFTAEEALNIGLVDVLGDSTEVLLRTHLNRLQRISKKSICQYKKYCSEIFDQPIRDKQIAISANQLLFKDPINLKNISRYIEESKFPWEK